MKRSRIALFAAVVIGLLGGSAIAVAAQEEATDAEPEAPVEFTARYEWDRQVSEQVEGTTEAGYDTLVGGAWQFKFVETSDPRIDGTMTDSETQVHYPSLDLYPDGDFWVGAGAWRIENEGGAWQQQPGIRFELPWPQEDGGGDGWVDGTVFVGEAGYEGYIALIQDTDGELRGVIIEDDLPAVPEPWSAG